MAEQIYWEDVQESMELPTLVKHPTSRQLVKWAGASGDYYEGHYDKDFALAKDLPGPMVHGRLVTSMLGQLVMDWIRELGTLKKLACQFRGINLPGQELKVKGKVTKKYVKDGEHFVECDVWAENPQGQVTTLGNATVVLPSAEIAHF